MRFITKLALFFCLCTPIFSIPIEKFKSALTFSGKNYSISPVESITLFGAKNKSFITPNWYWGEAGYGALGGRRSGYLEGGIMLGYVTPLNSPWMGECRLFAGAGGGGSAPQGGGCILEPTIGIGFPINAQSEMMLELGYITFLNGDIHSLTLGLSINWYYWNLAVPLEK